MRPEIPQTAASDEAAPPVLPVTTLAEEPIISEDEQALADGSPTPTEPTLKSTTESAAMPGAPLEPSQAGHTERVGRRVMRTSPAVLISCGLAFISLIFLLNLMTETGTTSAHRSTDSPAAPPVQQTSPAAPASAPEQVARINARAPEPKPSVQAAATPAPASEVASVEVASVAKQADAGATEKQASQPAPAPTPAIIDIQAPGTPRPASATPQGEDGFTLQIGSYNALAQAQDRVNELGAAGVSAYVARVEIPKRGTWYRVHVGHFGSREEANRQGTQLRSKGAVADFIVTTSKAS